MKKILVIQTAFIGDVILATAVLEKLHQHFPAARIDFLLRKGNESLFEAHPYLHQILIWDKKKQKLKNLFLLIGKARQNHYDLVVNLQRFLSSGLLTALSGANITTGFNKNPFSFFFSHAIPHAFGKSGRIIHEVERNLSVISKWTDNQFVKPKIYPSRLDFEKTSVKGKYITISPASIWFTKQLPAEKWIALIDRVGEDTRIFLLGGNADKEICTLIQKESTHPNTEVLAGRLTLLESAALMTGASMNFCNDSAPLHLASAVNAPVTAVYCSTVPAFGFTPLSDHSFMVETNEHLACRPCGLHGKKVCPEGHFRCSNIEVAQLLAKLA